jgi:hypothetical protein
MTIAAGIIASGPGTPPVSGSTVLWHIEKLDSAIEEWSIQEAVSK